GHLHLAVLVPRDGWLSRPRRCCGHAAPVPGIHAVRARIPLEEAGEGPELQPAGDRVLVLLHALADLGSRLRRPERLADPFGQTRLSFGCWSPRERFGREA